MGALGPQMVNLAGRDPSDVKWIGFVRMCIDDDADLARRTFAQSLLRYGLGQPGARRDRSFRGHFARMGFDDVLRRLEEQRYRGASITDLIDVLPVEVMSAVGYFGRPEGASEAFRRLARGLDTAVLRTITTAPGPGKVALALESVQPAFAPALA